MSRVLVPQRLQLSPTILKTITNPELFIKLYMTNGTLVCFRTTEVKLIYPQYLRGEFQQYILQLFDREELISLTPAQAEIVISKLPHITIRNPHLDNNN
jgi:hypothetical protein